MLQHIKDGSYKTANPLRDLLRMYNQDLL